MRLEDRVTTLEMRVDYHEKELEALTKTGDSLKKSLDGVERTLLQIKYLAIGALAVLVANEFGFMKALKVAFGIG